MEISLLLNGFATLQRLWVGQPELQNKRNVAVEPQKVRTPIVAKGEKRLTCSQGTAKSLNPQELLCWRTTACIQERRDQVLLSLASRETADRQGWGSSWSSQEGLAGKDVRPWDWVESAMQAHTAALANLDKAMAKPRWSRPSCQAACWGRMGG